MSVKGDAHADEEHKNKKQRKVISMLQKWGHWILPHNNAPVHDVFAFQEFLAKKSIMTFDHPPHFPWNMNDLTLK
jgi:hypothetical protein